MAQFRKDTNEYLPNNKTLFEVVMLADQEGNTIEGGNPTGTAVDAFGRMRISSPLTLFDSFNRYDENSKFVTTTANGGNTSYSADTSTINMEVDGSTNSEVIRESKRVFAYQPGKSLLLFNTFVMAEQSTALRQRVGYFNDENGIFVELNDTGVAFVKRTSISGSVENIAAYQSTWTNDKLDGTGPSGLTLDITKAQIFWMDIEWLGVGSVRCGFVIDGKMVHAHTFHHANRIDSTYMTTAILPIRYEIKNNGAAGSAATLKQICSTVMSEGGYDFRGTGGYASRGLTKKSVGSSFVPLMSLRLKSDRQDAIAVIQGISVTGDAAGLYEIKVLKGTSLTNEGFISAGDDSCVEYDINATAYSDGFTLSGNIAEITNQSSLTIDPGGDLFDLQLERDPSTSTSTIYTIIARTNASSADMSAAFNWQEVT